MSPSTAAVVNDEIIQKHLVNVFQKNDREALGLDPTTEQKRKQLANLPAAILDELVDRTLIAQEARRRGIEPTDTQLDADEKRFVTFCGGEQRFAAYLTQNGLTRREYRDNVLRTAATGHAVIEALTRELAVSDEEIKTYYEAHHTEADFQLPERVIGEHILVNARPGVLSDRLRQTQGLQPDTPAMNTAIAQETTRLRQWAETIRQEAVKPDADFAALARKYSDDVGSRDAGGKLGSFAHGVHPPALDDAFFALKPGEIGPVVQSEYGFHVLRISDRLPAGQKTLTEATPDIHSFLLRQKSARRLREWLAETRRGASIVVRDARDLPAPR